jgi:hypothetical protein
MVLNVLIVYSLYFVLFILNLVLYVVLYVNICCIVYCMVCYIVYYMVYCRIYCTVCYMVCCIICYIICHIVCHIICRIVCRIVRRIVCHIVYYIVCRIVCHILCCIVCHIVYRIIIFYILYFALYDIFYNIHDFDIHVFCFVQVVGRLSVLQGTSVFEETCDKCHLPTIIQREQGTYCFSCHCMVNTSSKARVLCKITGPKGDIYECIVSGPWIQNLLGCEVKSPEDFKASRGKYLRAFNIAKPEGTFVLSPSAEVVSFRPENAQISEAMSQFINDDVVADLNLEHEISLLQPYAIQVPATLVGSIPIDLKATSGFGQCSLNIADLSPVIPVEDVDLEKELDK